VKSVPTWYPIALPLVSPLDIPVIVTAFWGARLLKVCSYSTSLTMSPFNLKNDGPPIIRNSRRRERTGTSASEMWMADSLRENAVPVVWVSVASALKKLGSGTVADRSFAFPGHAAVADPDADGLGQHEAAAYVCRERT
jgi:hypothetical protein